MRPAVTWAVVFAVAIGFALLVDHGKSHLGVPDWFWLALNLTVVLWVLARFVGRPMAQFLDTRRGQIQQQLTAAEEKLAEAERIRVEVVERLARVEEEVTALKSRSEREGLAEAESILAQARLDEERFLRRVEDEIARRRAEAREELARSTAELTARLTRELLSREMTAADRARVFEHSLEALRALQEKA